MLQFVILVVIRVSPAGSLVLCPGSLNRSVLVILDVIRVMPAGSFVLCPGWSTPSENGPNVNGAGGGKPDNFAGWPGCWISFSSRVGGMARPSPVGKNLAIALGELELVLLDRLAATEASRINQRAVRNAIAAGTEEGLDLETL